MILVNRMYTGSYLNDNEGNNIGHEIINFFKADDKEKYIYITPYGKFNLTYKNEIEYILLTDATIGGKYNIIAKAKVDKCEIFENKNKFQYILRDEYKETHNNQAKNKKYGGKRLYDIYKDNIGNDEAIYATFKIKEIKRVKEDKKIEVNLNSIKGRTIKETVISVGNKEKYHIEHKEEKVKVKGKTKEKIKIPLKIGENNYIYLDEHEKDNSKTENKAYHYLMEIINNEKYWEEESTEKIEISQSEKQQSKENFNFLNLIEKEYDETIFTNMLAFYFNTKYKNTIILNEFLNWLKSKEEYKNKIKLNNVNFETIKKEIPIKLEQQTGKRKKKEINGRMDLFAVKDNNILVIENKIKSKINGKKENGFQLKFYEDSIKDNYTDCNNFIGMVFVPNYNVEIIKNEEGYINVKENYNVIEYSKIYEFFNNKIELKDIKDATAKKYYEDFKSSLFLHTLDAKEKEENKFKNAINNVNNQMKYTVYVLRFKCKNKKNLYKYYVGTTNNFNMRDKELSKKDKFKNFKKDEYLLKKEKYNLEDAFNLEEILEKNIQKKIKERKENSYLDEEDIKNILNNDEIE